MTSIWFSIYVVTIFFSVQVCSQESGKSVLTQYYQSNTGEPSIKLINRVNLFGVTRFQFSFKSLIWPEGNKMWHHRLSIYVPDKQRKCEALMLVNGGINRPSRYKSSTPYDNYLLPFFYGYVARKTQSLVVELKDVPNQYITFNDGRKRKEDEILAYAWRQYVENPLDLIWPPHLPMAKATSLAMNVVDSIAEEYQFTPPQDYVLTGISKRGWSSWLTALEDRRVVALVTAVNDILDTVNTMKYIWKSFSYWPEAFDEYLDEGIAYIFKSKNFKRLMEIEDPYRYIKKPKYQQRFEIPKYLIRASGDDFFVPDGQNNLIDTLPGDNYIRVLPNQGHHISGKDYMLALYDFYSAYISHKTLPTVDESTKDGRLDKVFISQQAVKISLWTAKNKKNRDFRFIKGVNYKKKDLSYLCRGKNNCSLKVPGEKINRGYIAEFVEVVFPEITLTTNVYVSEH